MLLVVLLCGCGAKNGDELPVSREENIAPQEVQEHVGYVALPFDDGPTRHTARLLDGLAERGIHATFFLVGYRLEGNEALVRRMKAEGHQIGNHTHDHAQLTTLSPQDALEDLIQCDLALCTLLGEGNYWVRPPYGSIHNEVLAQLDVPVVGWSIDPRDWACQDAAAVAQHIVSHAKDGDIILLHDCYASTVDAVLAAADRLQAEGLQMVTVEELLAVRGITAGSGTVYQRIG